MGFHPAHGKRGLTHEAKFLDRWTMGKTKSVHPLAGSPKTRASGVAQRGAAQMSITGGTPVVDEVDHASIGCSAPQNAHIVVGCRTPQCGQTAAVANGLKR